MKYSVNSVWENKDEYDVVVIGAGHAGCEAALACARLGIKTIIFTVSVDSIALMPCNPNIGGSSKGHLVKEVDALGGEMGKVIDQTFIQSKMLNKSKGPAVHSLRAQADKANYSKTMRMVLEISFGKRPSVDYYMYGGLAVRDGGLSHSSNTALCLTENGFTVTSGAECGTNTQGYTYRYLAIWAGE